MTRSLAGRLGAAGLAVALAGALLPLITVPASAGPVCSGFATGDGTAANPFLVTNAAELAAINDPACLASVFVQTADIDLGSVPSWTPIAENSSSIYSGDSFSGTYYGDCYTIDNLTVNSTTDGAALFFRSDGATFRNMKFTNVSLTTTGSEAGALVAYVDDSTATSTIDAVSAEGSVSSDYYAGMIIGEGGPTMTHVTAKGTVSATSDAGGLASYYGGTITESFADVDVTTSGNTAGGLIGTAQNSSSFTDVYARGDVTTTTHSGGGLIGTTGMTVLTLDSLYATGAVTGAADVGGIVGRAGSSFLPGVTVTYGDAFWDSTTTGQATSATGTDGSGTALVSSTGAKSTAQMQTAATFAAWSPLVWNLADGSYPTLKWFDEGGLDYCPRAATLDETSGSTAGGTTVTISGREWNSATGIEFGGVAATVSSIGSNSVTVTTPAGSVGSVDVTATVTVEGVSVPVTLPSAFTYAPAGQAPSRPKKPTIVAGDGEVTVKVARGSGGGVPASFDVTASPGGATCTVTSTSGGSCTISSGLVNGRDYTVTVTATNAFGTSPASVASEEFRPGPVITPKVVPVSERQPAGGSALVVNGQTVPVTVAPNQSSTGLTISAAGLTMTLDGLDANGKPMNLDANGVLILGQDREVQSTGTGFMPDSDIDLYVDPKVQAAGGRSKGTYVGTLRTDATGSFSGTATLPGGISVGVHDLQAVGVTRGNLPEPSLSGSRWLACPVSSASSRWTG